MKSRNFGQFLTPPPSFVTHFSNKALVLLSQKPWYPLPPLGRDVIYGRPPAPWELEGEVSLAAVWISRNKNCTAIMYICFSTHHQKNVIRHINKSVSGYTNNSVYKEFGRTVFKVKQTLVVFLALKTFEVKKMFNIFEIFNTWLILGKIKISWFLSEVKVHLRIIFSVKRLINQYLEKMISLKFSVGPANNFC